MIRNDMKVHIRHFDIIAVWLLFNGQVVWTYLLEAPRINLQQREETPFKDAVASSEMGTRELLDQLIIVFEADGLIGWIKY